MRRGRREKPSSGLLIISGMIKSNKHTGVCFAGWLLAVAVGCSVNNSAETTHVQNGNTGVQF